MWHNSNKRGWACPSPPPDPLVAIKTVTKASETTSGGGGETVFKKPLKRNHKMKLKICNTQLQIC